MKHLYTLFALILANTVSAQITNGSFEANGTFSLQGWEWACGEPQPVMDAPNGGGVWSASVQPGQAKGCFPSYLFQRLPNAQNGDIYTVSGWVRCADDNVNICIGAFMGLGTVHSGTFNVEETVGTSETVWNFVSIEDTVEVGAGDTALVILNSGFIGGPISPLSGLFDEIFVTGPEGIHGFNAPQLGLRYDATGNTLLASVAGQAIRAIDLFDLTGRKLPRAFRSMGGRALFMQTTDLPDGVYIVHVSTEAGECAARFVKH
jgi:hypothetical protein